MKGKLKPCPTISEGAWVVFIRKCRNAARLAGRSTQECKFCRNFGRNLHFVTERVIGGSAVLRTLGILSMLSGDGQLWHLCTWLLCPHLVQFHPTTTQLPNSCIVTPVGIVYMAHGLVPNKGRLLFGSHLLSHFLSCPLHLVLTGLPNVRC